MIESLQELFDDLVRHPMRTGLTAASVGWGTFMLVALLGLSEGLQNAVKYQYRDDAVNSVWIFRGKTSLPYQGHPVGRTITFDDHDLELLAAMDGVEHLTGRFYPPTRDVVIAYGDRRASFGLRSVHPDHRYLENTKVVAGRFLDDLDLTERRKVMVIGREVASFLFRARPDSRILGEWLDVAGTPFRVVGIFEDDGGADEMSEVYLPITTARTVFKGGDRVDMMMFTVGDATVEQTAKLTDEVRSTIGKAHHVNPKDRKALRVRNNLESFQELSRVFDLLAAFTWVVGVGTILAGIVGVSNIMLVSVRERTHEIGLRKALGATPMSVVGGIVREAVLLTAVSGYAGVVAGVLVIELLDAAMPSNETLLDPHVDLWVALTAVLVLTVAGAVAGFIPAWRAASVRPIEALKAAG